MAGDATVHDVDRDLVLADDLGALDRDLLFAAVVALHFPARLFGQPRR